MTPLVKILVDSSAGISPELAVRWGVGVVPLYLTWGERTYRDGIDLIPAEFHDQLARSETNPKTAAPNPADFVAACQEALASGYRHILIITVSSSISTTYNHACLAAREIGGNTISVLDSRQGAAAQALVAAYCARVAAAGMELANVLTAARAACQTSEVFIIANTLKYIRRSGRISGPQAMLGELIKIKPILTFVNGQLRVIKKLRTMRRATRYLVARVVKDKQSPDQVLAIYADISSPAFELAKLIRQHYPDIEIDISPVSGAVMGNVGPGLLGIAVRWRDNVRG